jgi:hypothetical protein
MSKAAITRLFILGMIAVVAGTILAAFAVLAAFATGGIVLGGPGFVEIHGGRFASALLVLTFAVLVITAGGVIGLASWIAALVNTARLDDKTWFVGLLVLGLWNFGFVAMVAYVLAGPDGWRTSDTPVRSAVSVGEGKA